jgi:hypothetical protein
VVLGLNVAHDAPDVIEKLARFAQEGGATDKEIQMMLLRNYFQIDSSLIPQDALVLSMQEEELAKMAKLAASGGPGRRGGGRIDVDIPPMVNPAPRRNPPPSRQEQRDIEEAVEDLEARREKLGWDKLKDLP